MEHGAVGTFHWPAKEFVPYEVLGKSCEALDQIRMDCSAYVVYRPEIEAFQVMARNADVIKTALLRLRQTVFQVVAKQMNPVRQYLLHLPGMDASPVSVRLEDYERPRLLSDHSTDARRVGHAPRGVDSDGNSKRDLAKETLETRDSVRLSILEVLEKLRYYRGSIEMRIHHGRLLATQFRSTDTGMYDLEDYEFMLKESQFQAHVTDE